MGNRNMRRSVNNFRILHLHTPSIEYKNIEMEKMTITNAILQHLRYNSVENMIIFKIH